MKLFHRKEKKKPLTDKQKLEKKAKVKKYVKLALDILVYGFTAFMLFALVLSSCQSKTPKSASAVYHSEEGYTSITEVVCVPGETQSTIRYFYDYHYPTTFVNWSNIFDISDIRSGVSSVMFSPAIIIDDVTYDYLELSKISNSLYEFRIYAHSSDLGESISFIEFHQTNGTHVLRSDIFTDLFSGNHNIFVDPDYYDNKDIAFFKFLTYYYGNLGYSRITYNFPINVSRLGYLFSETSFVDPTLEFNYFFQNDNFPELSTNDRGQYLQTSTFQDISCTFLSNGVYYTGIRIVFSSVFGISQSSSTNFLNSAYILPGSTEPVHSDDERYFNYWYIESINFTNSNFTTNVWHATTLTGSSATYWQYTFTDTWVGDTAYSSSPYRSCFIYKADDAFSGTIHHPFEDFVQLENMSVAQFLNYIGEAYPSGNIGVVQDTSSPFSNVFAWLRSALNGVMPFFGYTLIPGITLGTLIMIPITMSIILWVVGLFKR